MDKNFNSVSERLLRGADRHRTEEPAAPEPQEEDRKQKPIIEKAAPERPQREMKTARTYLLLKPSTKQAIKKAAEAQGYNSMNDLINQILEAYLNDYTKGEN